MRIGRGEQGHGDDGHGCDTVHPAPEPATGCLKRFVARDHRSVPCRMFKNLGQYVEIAIIGVLAIAALAGIIRFIILADVF